VAVEEQKKANKSPILYRRRPPWERAPRPIPPLLGLPRKRQSRGAPIDAIQVNETEMSLDPSDITLDRPGTYVFRAVNVGEVVHSLRIEGNGIEERQTGEIGPGESADLTIMLGPGTYELNCPAGNHEELGLRGRVTVQEG
jgi:uncharacterized cupredoxin-like copper-binding protein